MTIDNEALAVQIMYAIIKTGKPRSVWKLPGGFLHTPVDGRQEIRIKAGSWPCVAVYTEKANVEMITDDLDYEEGRSV